MTGAPSTRPTGPSQLPYGTPVRVGASRISLTCLATCTHGNACTIIAERGPDEVVSLYFHGTTEHGARLAPAQIDALQHWLADHDDPDAATTD
jgi:hypothetical protein